MAWKMHNSFWPPVSAADLQRFQMNSPLWSPEHDGISWNILVLKYLKPGHLLCFPRNVYISSRHLWHFITTTSNLCADLMRLESIRYIAHHHKKCLKPRRPQPISELIAYVDITRFIPSMLWQSMIAKTGCPLFFWNIYFFITLGFFI